MWTRSATAALLVGCGFLNLAGGTPVASISGTGNNDLSLDGSGNNGTTIRQILSIGTAATGDVNFVLTKPSASGKRVGFVPRRNQIDLLPFLRVEQIFEVFLCQFLVLVCQVLAKLCTPARSRKIRRC